VAEPLWFEYGERAVIAFLRAAGLSIEPDHAAFRAELDAVLGPRGRLFLARIGDEIVGTGALKPLDGTTGELKRMYVATDHRGEGIGRCLLDRILAAARSLGYRRIRLDTLEFMSEAQALYRSVGFAEIEPYAESESARSGVAAYTRYMELDLQTTTAATTGKM
jgi:GNAT superfamily N-acetyltransferase